MHNFDVDNLAGALQASKENRLVDWIHAFLQFGRNPNIGLLEGLKKVPTRCYLQPVLFPLVQLSRICGPESNLQYRVSQEHWDHKIPLLEKRIQAGWQPTPLLAPGVGTDAFKIFDGTHRHAALLKTGYTQYWVIFIFDNEDERAYFNSCIEK